MSDPNMLEGTQDQFNGNDEHLVRCIVALLKLDAANVLVPHGVGGHGRALLSAAAVRLFKQLQVIEVVDQHLEDKDEKLAKLLSVVFRDGGEYVAHYGLSIACRDAKIKVNELHDNNEQLGALLAYIHRDGGHHESS